jgi:hypothetical protein
MIRSPARGIVQLPLQPDALSVARRSFSSATADLS